MKLLRIFQFLGDRNTQICGAASVKCYQAAERELFEEIEPDDANDFQAKVFRDECNCLPACTSIEYDVNIERAKFDWIAIMEASNMPYTGSKK